MAYYNPQIWASDDSDAIDRLSIQYGTSLVYPQSMMTSHVSVSPNEQMAGLRRLRRVVLSQCGGI